MDSHLVNEFCTFYKERRCKYAPPNPMRCFGLATHVFQEHRRQMSEWELLSVTYRTLDGLFKAFDPSKYHGGLPLPEHFINMFASRLKVHLRRSVRPRSDNGRKGEGASFRGMRRQGRLTLHSERAVEAVRDAVDHLGQPDRAIIRGRYWDEFSDREIGRRLRMDHKTVRQKHDRALATLRLKLAA